MTFSDVCRSIKTDGLYGDTWLTVGWNPELDCGDNVKAEEIEATGDFIGEIVKSEEIEMTGDFIGETVKAEGKDVAGDLIGEIVFESTNIRGFWRLGEGKSGCKGKVIEYFMGEGSCVCNGDIKIGWMGDGAKGWFIMGDIGRCLGGVCGFRIGDFALWPGKK